MKKNNYDLYEKGQEISIVTFQQHQNQVLETINALVLALGIAPASPAILYGLENTGLGTNYDLSAGAIYAKGEIFLVDAFTGAAGPGQVAFLRPVNVPVGDAVTFEDGTVVAVHLDHKYEVALGTPQPATDEFAYADADRFSDKLNALLGANAYTDQQVAAMLGGVDPDMDSLAKIADAINGLQGGGSANSPVSFIQNLQSPDWGLEIQSNSTLHFASADIPAGRIVASVARPRTVTIFCDTFYRKEGTADDDTNISIVYRQGTSGAWTSLRGKYLKADSNVRHLSLRAQLKLTATNVQSLQFGLRQIHDANGSMYVSEAHKIEFDTIY